MVDGKVIGLVGGGPYRRPRSWVARAVWLAALAMALGLSAQVAAKNVYKWVDENGKTQYSDTPPAEVESEKVRIDEEDPAAAAEARARAERQQRLLKSYEADRKDRAATQAKKADELAQRNQHDAQCEQARRTLQRYQDANYLYKKDAAGERKILSDELRRQAQQKLAGAISQNCK